MEKTAIMRNEELGIRNGNSQIHHSISSKNGKSLEGKLLNKTAKIGVIGLGYVGLPLAVEFAVKGYDVVGIDLDPTKIASLQSGKNYIQDLKDEVVEGCLK